MNVILRECMQRLVFLKSCVGIKKKKLFSLAMCDMVVDQNSYLAAIYL